MLKKKYFKTCGRKLCSGLTAFIFLINIVLQPIAAWAQFTALPSPGTILPLSPSFTPALLRGITIHPDNPLSFDFIVNLGDTNLEGESLKKEGERLIKYFLTTLTIPEDDLWVNLSPYEHNRIIPEELSQTEMGRDMLAQDYLLKQLSASMMVPDEKLGAKFWSRVYKKAQEEYGTTDIPINTFNKIWIVPEVAHVHESGNTALV